MEQEITKVATIFEIEVGFFKKCHLDLVQLCQDIESKISQQVTSSFAMEYFLFKNQLDACKRLKIKGYISLKKPIQEESCNFTLLDQSDLLAFCSLSPSKGMKRIKSKWRGDAVLLKKIEESWVLQTHRFKKKSCNVTESQEYQEIYNKLASTIESKEKALNELNHLKEEHEKLQYEKSNWEATTKKVKLQSESLLIPCCYDKDCDFRLLRLRHDCREDQVDAAYRLLSLHEHPDKHEVHNKPSQTLRFQQLTNTKDRLKRNFFNR